MNQKYGLIGEKLSHSLSPLIHRAVFDETDREAAYDLIEIEPRHSGHIAQKLWHEGYRGANVTIPYKQTVMRQLDEISPEAEKIGAVNTISISRGRFFGDNTDYFGFGKMLEVNGIATHNKTAVVLGAGGAAKAVLAYLADNGAKRITVVSREGKQKPGFAQFDVEWADYRALAQRRGDLLINCTPVGMYPNQGDTPVGRAVVERFDTLVDLIYNPRQTEFLRLGRLCGKQTCNGLYMLVAQAVLSEEIWQRRKIDDALTQRIYQALDDRLSEPPRTNVVLIGMPGSGKTTIGRKAARELGYAFCDMDETVEQLAGQSIPALFEKGEDVFRDWESKACEHLAECERTVIACGGGVVLRPENLKTLKRTGVVYYLDRPVERIAGDIRLSTRPLLRQGKQRLYALYNDRAALYQSGADEIVPNDGQVPDTVQALVQRVKRKEALL